MNPFANKTGSVNGLGNTTPHSISRRLIDVLANVLTKLSLLRQDADHHLLRASMG